MCILKNYKLKYMLFSGMMHKHLNYCITGNVNVFLIFPNLPNGLQTGKIKTLSLSIFVGMVWQTMFAGDDVSESEF